jgi:hypothetical protein
MHATDRRRGRFGTRQLQRHGWWAVFLALPGCSLIFPVDAEHYAQGDGHLSVDVVDGSCGPDAACLESGSMIEVGSYVGNCPQGDGGSGADLASLLGLVQTSTNRQIVPVAQHKSVVLAGVGKGKQAFYVTVRDPDCGVVAWGCTDLAVDLERTVSVALGAAESPRLGACSGSGCMCTTANAMPEGGIACDLEVVAAHALPAAIAEDAYLNGPGIVATGDAFMLALATRCSR